VTSGGDDLETAQLRQAAYQIERLKAQLAAAEEALAAADKLRSSGNPRPVPGFADLRNWNERNYDAARAAYDKLKQAGK
jgi:primosomal protein N''